MLGQALLAVRMGKRRVIAETGAGQHGVATATACALLDLECVVYMGSEDIRRQELNVVRMRLLGATVVPVESGSRTLKDAMNEALRDWVTNVRDTFYVIGSVAGPAPYPAMVRDFQAVIGAEAREQVLAAPRPPARRGRRLRRRRLQRHGPLPRLPRPTRCASPASRRPARVSTGAPRRLAHAAAARRAARLVQVPAAGRLGSGAPRRTRSRPGSTTPASGPSTPGSKTPAAPSYAAATDAEALAAFQPLAELEGIIPALESAHAVAYVLRGPEPPRSSAARLRPPRATSDRQPRRDAATRTSTRPRACSEQP